MVITTCRCIRESRAADRGQEKGYLDLESLWISQRFRGFDPERTLREARCPTTDPQHVVVEACDCVAILTAI
jgi:hypothetical protein